MPETADEISARLEGAASTSFREFSAALVGSGVGAQTDWSNAQADAARLSGLSHQAASGIRKLHEDTTLSDGERRARINDITQTATDLMRGIDKDLAASVAKVEASLLEAQRVLPEHDPSERSMIRNEIDQLVAAETAKRTPEKPGKSMLVILMELAQQSPRYAAEIADTYGTVKMQAAGEVQFIANLHRAVIGLASANTPLAQAAKRAMDTMNRLKVKGHLPGLSFSARERIAAANSAKPAGRPAWQPDTLIPRQ
jgi:hypothetical protein